MVCFLKVWKAQGKSWTGENNPLMGYTVHTIKYGTFSILFF